MNDDIMSSVPVKPRVLIADDSRIVRAALIKRIEGLFEFREAPDGEQAWETLLLDPNIRVVITDLTMPKLDGYGLLQRIRSSRIQRIRELPVVVVSGSDEQEERTRARAAGATDLITKGIAAPQLLSRLEVLSKLVVTQREFERGLEALARTQGDVQLALTSPSEFWAQAQAQLSSASASRKNFVVLTLCVGLRHQRLEGLASSPPAIVVDAIGQLLQRAIRSTDLLAKTGEGEFTLATGSINIDSARCFAQRITRSVAKAHMVNDEQMSFIAACGVASLRDDTGKADASGLRDLCDRAHRRALLGLNLGLTGAVGSAEEQAFGHGEQGVARASGGEVRCDVPAMPEIATLLQWMKEGRQTEVMPHLGRLSAELKPLVELLQQQMHGEMDGGEVA